MVWGWGEAGVFHMRVPEGLLSGHVVVLKRDDEQACALREGFKSLMYSF